MSVWLAFFYQLILIFRLFLLLLTDLIALFDTIHESHCTIPTKICFYLQYFQQKVFSFNKISRFQTDQKCGFGSKLKVSLFYYSTYFCYYSWVILHFLVLFMGLTVLFQLTFTFIYSTFSKKFSVLAK